MRSDAAILSGRSVFSCRIFLFLFEMKKHKIIPTMLLFCSRIYFSLFKHRQTFSRLISARLTTQERTTSFSRVFSWRCTKLMTGKTHSFHVDFDLKLINQSTNEQIALSFSHFCVSFWLWRRNYFLIFVALLLLTSFIMNSGLPLLSKITAEWTTFFVIFILTFVDFLMYKIRIIWSATAFNHWQKHKHRLYFPKSMKPTRTIANRKLKKLIRWISILVLKNIVDIEQAQEHMWEGNRRNRGSIN